MSDFLYLNPDNFKKWMKNQDEFDSSLNQDFVGLRVETRFGAKRIMHKMTLESGKSHKVARDFVENGGTVLDVVGEEFLVEVKSGSFLINKNLIIF
jgi:hypothetical protein